MSTYLDFIDSKRIKVEPCGFDGLERAVKLWSAPGETVLSPFAGIGSEGYQSILLGRKFIGIELKESYWRTAAKNLAVAEHKAAQPLDIFRSVTA